MSEEQLETMATVPTPASTVPKAHNWLGAEDGVVYPEGGGYVLSR